jgi:CheY-like chemotaxis protein
MNPDATEFNKVLQRPAHPARPRLLFVDDDPDARILYARHLRLKYGWDVVECEEGSQALRILDTSFHAVVLDEMMPGLRGMQVLQTIRQRPDIQELCVVMLTSTTDPEVITSTFEYSPNAYLMKSKTNPEALYITLASNISRKSSVIRPVKTFLCHSKQDKAAVRELYFRLTRSFVEPWFDEENLIGGQDWDYEIRNAVKSSEIILVCLSNQSVTRPGYLQKEIRMALDAADEQLPGAIFIIPLLLEHCPVPERLAKWQWIDYTQPDGWERLMRSIRTRAKALGL